MVTDPAEPAAHPLVSAFRGTGAPQPRVRVLRKAGLLVSEFFSDQPLLVTGTVPQDDAYVVTLHLRARPRGRMSAEGRWISPENFAAGHAGIVDLRMRLLSHYDGPFHYLTAYVTRATLDGIADELGAPRGADLRHRPGIGFADPVLRHLLVAVRPALAAADETSTLYAEHAARAVATHLAAAYGGLRPRAPEVRGGLAPWQERRAKELLDARLAGDVTLAELAEACALSVRHFTRAFRQSTGQSPNQWLVERRLDRAQGLLESSERSLGEIAAACGFASQSHFTRVFRGALGTSPGAWRRERRG
jgi:AraC family transcriptional regulator